ncbi:response regulator [Caballeronia concitans]|uniref:histidine kinase n=1 Tax=Caballeronia concitans TaxID=1777133 RepID=A0A658QZK1_9BURK|nr:response regulator [Caballeronia concitans]KIG10678.1 multi-sensor hybrid histidine kinase [Burkholderia sp. MR1]SAL35651.1 sensor kinase/response regulator fusion protein [Caballeronia concitans]
MDSSNLIPDMTSRPGDPSFLLGGGEMGVLIRGFDWTQTTLGEPVHWPQSLKTAIRIMLTSRQPIWIGWGRDLLFFYNDAYKSIIGGKHPHALGQPTSAVWREIWNDIGPLLDTALAGVEGTFVEQKLLIMERNGFPEETYYTFSYSPIPDDRGGAGGIICANSDDTQRVLGERQLLVLRELATYAADARTWREACERSMKALRNAPRDMPFALLYAAEPGNQTATLVGACGIAPGHPAAPETVHAGQREPWPIHEVLRDNQSRLVTNLHEHIDAPLPSGAWNAAPTRAVLMPIAPTGETGHAGVLVVALNPYRLFDDGYRAFMNLVAGQIGAAIGYAHAYDEERRRAEALAEIDRAKTTFFSNISHEFRTPLTLMLGPLEEMLANHERVAPGDVRLVEMVHRNGLRLLKLVNALLDFSRIEAGRIEIHRQTTDIAAFTAELASLFRSAIETAGLELRTDIPDTPLLADIDRDMWEKVVMNLLSNAFKFTFDGAIIVSLHARGDSEIEMCVRDTGIGIPADELERVFERFHRVAGATGRSVEGSGIGLAMVHELVKLHGGRIGVESRPGKGACFRVTLPAAQPTAVVRDDASRAEASSGARSYVDAALRWTSDAANEAIDAISDINAPLAHAEGDAALTGRVLVVDDNTDLRDYMRRMLASAGHDVIVAADGAAALEAARALRPEVIVSDVMMPRLDGFGLLRAVREDETLRETPVVLLSARAGEEARVGGLDAGADDYLTKPFSARELLARVSSNLRLARLRQETERKLREDSRVLEVLNRVGTTIAAELDLSRAVQVVTDAATELTGAAFGSFFYNVLDNEGGSYTLYALSGVPKDSFSKFPMPRNTSVFGPTFRGEGIVRSADITKDPRYGHNAPHHGMPKGHLAVRSYLAAPVVSRTGEVLGGLFFGHPEPDIFHERAEQIIEGIAAQAAIAIDNARLFQAAQDEIAERTKAQTALRDLNETLERRVTEVVADRDRLWELSEDLFVIASFDGALLRVSPSWASVLGMDEQRLHARTMLELVHPDDAAAAEFEIDRLRASGTPVRYECRLARMDGGWRWIAWTLSLDPRTRRIHGVGRDVTADRETADALRHAEEALRMAQKMEAIGKLTGGVAHDFNNLLQVIGGNLQLLVKDVAGHEKAEQRVRSALAGVVRGANLASQLLAFGRRQPLAPKVVNLGRFVRGLDDMFRRALGDGIEIETVITGGLWNTLVDPFQVENALLNLAINARDAMNGHGKLTIEAGNASLDETYALRNVDVLPGQYVMVAVTDTGAGMSPEVQERAFEPFFTTKREGQGTGLGLSMVYGFVKQSGGHVKVYSEEGHGTTVRIYLPRAREEEDLETNVEAGPAKGGTETILVVEDDEEVRATVVELLADLGYRVLRAKDAMSALAIVESGVPIDLIFTDVVMPGPLRSTELARKARERVPGIGVLFTSGYTDNAIVHAGRLDEGIDLLSKPYTHEALARKVRLVLGRNVHDTESGDAPAKEPETAQQDALAARRVLFVEDNELVRTSSAELLRTMGLDLMEAASVDEAMTLLREHRFDVLLTDVDLAGKSGVELAMAARRDQPALGVVFVTGYELALSDDERKALPRAIQVRKPYDPFALVDALNAAAAA